MSGVGDRLGTPRGTFHLVLLNASYRKKHEYIWFRGEDLNGFLDINTLTIGWALACLKFSLCVQNFKISNFLAKLFMNNRHINKKSDKSHEWYVRNSPD